MTTLCLSEVSHAFELLFYVLACYACILHGLDKWQSYKIARDLEKRLAVLVDKIQKGESELIEQNITFNVEKIIQEK